MAGEKPSFHFFYGSAAQQFRTELGFKLSESLGPILAITHQGGIGAGRIGEKPSGFRAACRKRPRIPKRPDSSA
jgi:hypothetical protein